MSRINKKNSVFGCLPKALLGNFALGLLALVISAFWGGPKMAISQEAGINIFFFLFLVYGALIIWSIFSMAQKRKINQLQTAGPFAYVQHPMYGAIIFLLNPAVAFLLRSWLLLLAVLPVYFVWKKSVLAEERELNSFFGQKYLRYQSGVWRFFPNLFSINRSVFLVFFGAAVFSLAFVILNLPSFYLHWVDWDKEAVAPELPPLIKLLPESNQKEKKYDKIDSIVIAKIGIDAPLVITDGTTQKDLNQALDRGVIIYPGSVFPGKFGNLFLTGHSSVLPWNKTEYGQIFAQLDRLEAGDRVTVYFQKEKFEYEILKKEVLPSNKVLLKHEQNAPTLTLMTCWPIGTSLKRLVLSGIMVE